MQLTKNQVRTIHDLSTFAETDDYGEPEIHLTVSKGDVTLKIQRRVDYRDEVYNAETNRSHYPKKAFRVYTIHADGNSTKKGE
jgi:hypothetical protein